MRPLVYIAGPYTHPDPVTNTRAAVERGLALYETGIAVPIVPHLTMLAHAMFPHPVEYWYRFDLEQVEHCDAVYRIPGQSTGADMETGHAQKLGIPVFTDFDNLLVHLAKRSL